MTEEQKTTKLYFRITKITGATYIGQKSHCNRCWVRFFDHNTNCIFLPPVSFLKNYLDLVFMN